MTEQSVIDQVWAWLYAKNRTYRLQTLPDGSKIEQGFKQKDVERMVSGFLTSAINTIFTAYDWPFEEAQSTFDSEVGVSEYEITGGSDDCRNIINIVYAGDVLEKKNTLEQDRRDSDTTDSGVYCWTEYGVSDGGFPLIQIHNTPSAVETFTYRYRKNGLTIIDIPDRYDYVIVDAVKARFDDSLRPIAEMSLMKMVADYSRGGDEYETIRKDPRIESGNIRRAGLQGGV